MFDLDGSLCVERIYDPSQSIQVGDVIGFRISDGGRIGHRVIRIDTVEGERRYITKGDNLVEQDPSYRIEKDIENIELATLPTGPLRWCYIKRTSIWRHLLSRG